jgi:hypothetical protein
MSEQTYKIFITEEGVEKDLTREDIVELLYNDVATITFTKADGTERVMVCTLLQEVLKDQLTDIPTPNFDKEPIIDESQLPKKEVNQNTIAVYDVQVEDWRSFRVDSVKSISIPLPPEYPAIQPFNEAGPSIPTPELPDPQ